MKHDAWVEPVLDAWRRGQQLGAVGPGRLTDHLDHARSLAGIIGELIDRPEAHGLDLGTGAGLPGLALAGFLPQMRWTLLDASRRRIAVVAAAIERLQWAPRVTAVHARAEEHARDHRAAADVVVARLFGRPAVTAECAAPLVRPGGHVVVTEPPAGDEDRWPDPGLHVLGLRRGRRSAAPAVQVLDAIADPEARFPRKPGVAERRPLW